MPPKKQAISLKSESTLSTFAVSEMAQDPQKDACFLCDVGRFHARVCPEWPGHLCFFGWVHAATGNREYGDVGNCGYSCITATGLWG